MKKTFLLTFLFLSLYFCLFGLQKINLTASDIGRHVTNGDIILHSNATTIRAVLYTNFFSYTNPNFPFINHHWGSGVLAYIAYSLSGWSGLEIAFILLMLGALYFSFRIAWTSAWWIAVPLTLLYIPLITERVEVRPEGISCLFLMLFIYILYRCTSTNEGHDQKKWSQYLWSLPFLMLLWANLHIYFIFGFFVLGAFGLQTLIRKQWGQFKKLLIVSIVSLVTACINPFGPKLLLYPFTIFKSYGYLVAENQSIRFLEKLNFVNPNFLWWKITFVLMMIISVWTLIKNRRDFPIAFGIIAITFTYLSFAATRNFSLFGLVVLPYLGIILRILLKKFENREDTKKILWGWSATLSILIIIFSMMHFSNRMPWHNNGQNAWGIGLLPNNMGSAEFVKKVGITGPFFENYDIGSYFIFTQPTEKVFVDNRPEAYPPEFFQNEYIPMQQDDSVWKVEEEKYHFNAIWFYRLDMTPWAQQFLITRVGDAEWVPVFVDDYTIIFVKNVPQNQSIISKYALPKSMFTVR